MIGLAVRMARSHAAGSVSAFGTMAVCCAMIAGALDVLVAASAPIGTMTQPAGSTTPLELLRSGAASAMGLTMTFTGFAGVFLMGQAVSFALGARVREAALLRLVGARARQVGRLMVAEFALYGAAAGAVGFAFGWPVAGVMARLLGRSGMAPAGLDLTPRPWTLPVMLAVGAVVAAIGARAPARRTARVGPIAALSDTEGVRQAMTPRRWGAVVVLMGGTALVASLPLTSPDMAATASVFVNLLALGALAALAPLLVPPAVRLIGVPLAALSPGPGRLAVEHTRLAARRAASLAEPLLLAVGMPGGLLTLIWSLNHSRGQSAGMSAADLAAQDSENVLSVAVLAGAVVVIAIAAMVFSAVAGARERREEFVTLRRLGAARGHVLISVGVESLLITVVAGLALVADLWFVRLRAGQVIALMGGGEPMMPLGWLAAMFAVSAAIGLVASIAAAAATMPRT